ncbi:MAG: ABC transporter permease [Gammaproteobacteria bacterium]|nr:ABC transporter permease [Gammaproteobacteria bacterium]
MNKFIALLKKEALVLSKDWHGLLVLFVMPAVFILIMSLAMQNAFDEQQNVIIEYAIVNHSEGELGDELIGLLKADPAFKATILDQAAAPLNSLVASERYKFAIVIPEDFPQRLAAGGDENGAAPVLQVLIAPTVKSYLKQLFVALVRGGIVQLRMAQLLADGGSLPQQSDSSESDLPDSQNMLADLSQVDLSLSYVMDNNNNNASSATPSSVQQNVPAWLIFAMFFVIIPISTAFIIEKQQGTFVRLRLLNLSALHLMLAKLAPYYVVNLIQMAAMIAVGMAVVPLLGGDRLNWPSSAAGLFIITSAASFAAIGFALLIATLAKTTVQATTMGGVFNIIFGALGGIMVPKFVMPPTMQEITVVSPMSWGLEGFLDVFLRNQPWHAVLPESLALLGFGVVCLIAAIFLFKRLV